MNKLNLFKAGLAECLMRRVQRILYMVALAGLKLLDIHNSREPTTFWAGMRENGEMKKSGKATRVDMSVLYAGRQQTGAFLGAL